MAIVPRIVGWGKYLPKKVVSNRDLEKLIDTSDDWIRSRTGIVERHFAGKDETASKMAAKAGKQALERAKLNPNDLDLIIVATSTAEKLFPACSSLVQDELGAKKASAFDVNAACSGFIYALSTAYQYVMSGTYKNVLIVGSEVFSRILNWEDRTTCVLFGDGAGAVVIQASEDKNKPPVFVLGSDGSKGDLLFTPGICEAPSKFPPGGRFFISMRGHQVFKLAVRTMIKATLQAIQLAGLRPNDINLFIPHQANIRIIDAAAKALHLPQNKVFINLDKYGNTSSASIPIALCEAVEGERIKQGDHIAIVSFGGGLSWGAMAFQWS